MTSMPDLQSYIPYKHQHHLLGDLTGRLVGADLDHSVVNFRSIPYATIHARFKPSILLHKIPEFFDSRPHRDFTEYGAACPQTGGNMESWFDPLGGPQADDLGLHFDEMTCLTLSIATPRSALYSPTSSLLPVMVYIHGGGLETGFAHVDGHHNPCRMVAYGAQNQMPVVVVNIGYRLNWFGFLACKDLLEEAETEAWDSKDGIFNQGLQDQRKALRRIKANIAGFGGDPGQITAFGESAGSVSLTYHLCGNEPLFQRVILQSCGVWGNWSMEEKETVYQALLRQCNIHYESGPERLAALRAISADALPAPILPGTHLFPYLDQDVPHLYPRGMPTYSNQFKLVAECPWIESLIIGNDQNEGNVLLPLLKNASASKFVDAGDIIFGSHANSLLAEYDISSNMESILFRLNMSLLLGDIWLTEPIHNLADVVSKTKPVYKYTFSLTNPWPGSDCAFVTGHHFIEILFVFLTLLERYPKRRNRFLERQAYGTAHRWISFAHGHEPWPRYVAVKDGGEGTSAICDDRQGWCVRSKDEDDQISQEDPWGERRYKGLELLRLAWTEKEAQGGDALDAARRASLTSLFMQ